MASKQIHVLASHEPDLDPRIDWVARFAAKILHVNVYGMADISRPGPTLDAKNGYQIERLTRSFRGIFSFGLVACRCFAREPFFWLILMMGVVLAPVVVLRLLINGFAAIVRKLMAVLRWLIPKGVKDFLKPVVRQLSFPFVISSRKLARFAWISRHFLTTAITLFRGVEAKTRPDVVYCNDLDTLFAGAMLKWRFGCKLIYDAHEFWAHSDPASPWWEVRFFLWYEKKLLTHVDAAFTVNHLLAEQMQAALDHPFHSLPNCEPLAPAVSPHIWRLDDSRQTMSPQHTSSLDEIAQGRVRFLFQGQFAPERGILELLHVWKRVAPEKAVLFLRGPDNQHKAPCVELARELGILDKSVFFLEPILETELVSAASEVDIGIIPYKPVTINYRYCCPNKLSQYMQAGLAILANNSEFVKATIDRYQCGLTYSIEDAEGTLAVINRLINEEPFRHACQRQSRAMFVKEFNWEEQSRTLYEVCARLVDLETAPASAAAMERVA